MIINRESVKELTSKLSEPTWLADSRLEAWESYLQTPMPTERDEDWRGTDLGLLDLSALHTVTMDVARDDKSSAQVSKSFTNALKHFESNSGVFYQSTKGGALLKLSPEAEKAGVIFCDLATAADRYSGKLSQIQRYLLEAPDKSKFSLLTRALFNCGAFLYLPRNVEIKQPFVCGLDFDGAGNGEQGSAIFPRLVVIAEGNAKAELIFVLSSDTGTADAKPVSLVSGLVEFHLAPGSRLDYLEVQELPANVFYVERVESRVDQNATFNSLSIALGGKQTKSEVATFLQAPGANSSVLGVVLGSDNEKFSYNTIQEHNAPDTTSDINFRVALKDHSSSVYQGIIRVDKIAQRTAAYQSNKNLLLGGDAKADSIPKLEILADDVKCSHGATVGPVDREQLFYLRSRGLTPVEAEELVVLGFFKQVLEQFPVQSAMDWLTEVVSKKVFRSGEA